LIGQAQELIVEKCMRCFGDDVGPANVLRSVFQYIGSDILLPGKRNHVIM